MTTVILFWELKFVAAVMDSTGGKPSTLIIRLSMTLQTSRAIRTSSLLDVVYRSKTSREMVRAVAKASKVGRVATRQADFEAAGSRPGLQPLSVM